MTNTIGKVEFLVEADGRALPRQLRRIGREAGASAGKGFSDSFNSSLGELGKQAAKKMKAQLANTMGEQGKFAGISFSKSLDNVVVGRLQGLTNQIAGVFADKKGLDSYAAGFDSIGKASERLGADLAELKDNGVLSEKQLNRTLKIIEKWQAPADKARKATEAFNRELSEKKAAEEFADGLERAWKAAEKVNESLNMKARQKEIAASGKEIKRLGAELDANAKAWDLNNERIIKYRGEISRAHGEAVKMNDALDALKTSAAQKLADDLERSWKAAEKLNDRLNMQERQKEIAASGREIKRLNAELNASAAAWDLNNERVIKYRGEINRAHGEAIKMNDALNKSRVVVGSASVEADRGGGAFARLRESLSGVNEKSLGFFRIWSTLPRGFRRVAFFTGLFAALGESIAVLGSASGSSLAVLGTGFLALGLGAGVLVAGIVGITGPIEKVAAAARPASVALKEMGKVFTDIRQDIQGALFEGLDTSIRNMTTKLLPSLRIGFVKTAKTLNGFLSATAASLTSEASLTRLNNLFDGLQPILASLGRATIGLGGSLARIFEAALPITKDFTDSMARALDEFNAFLDTKEGQDRLAGFFATLERVAPAVGGLLGAVGKALAGLVTDESITRFENTLQALEDFTPALGSLLGAIGNLDPIGLIAGFLKTLGDNLTPVVPSMQALSEAANENLNTILTGLAEAIAAIATAITPGLASFLEELAPGLDAVFKSVSTDVDNATIDKNTESLRKLGQVISDILIWASDPESAKVLNDLQQGLTDLAASLRAPFVGEDTGAKWEGLWKLIFPPDIAELSANNLAEISAFFDGLGTELDSFNKDSNGWFGELGAGFRRFMDDTSRNLSALPLIAGIVVTRIVAFFQNLPANLALTFAKIAPEFTREIGKVVLRAKGVVDEIVGFFRGLPGRISGFMASIGTFPGGFKLPFTASGGIFEGAQARVIGEAGAEAVVPLNRPLSQVDPAVRALSAFAQGLSLPGGGSISNGGSRGNRSSIVEAGAIQVITPARDPAIVASQVLDRLVAEL